MISGFATNFHEFRIFICLDFVRSAKSFRHNNRVCGAGSLFFCERYHSKRKFFRGKPAPGIDSAEMRHAAPPVRFSRLILKVSSRHTRECRAPFAGVEFFAHIFLFDLISGADFGFFRTCIRMCIRQKNIATI
jgi:hypothetical protein